MPIRPTIYRVTSTGVNPSPGSGQYLGFTIQNGSLVPAPTLGLFSEAIGTAVDATANYSERGLIPKMPTSVVSGLGVIATVDDYSKVATNLIAGKSYETAIAIGEAGGGGLGAGTAVGLGRFVLPAVGISVTNPFGLFLLGAIAAGGGLLGKLSNGAAAGERWIRENAPKLDPNGNYETAITVNGKEYIAVMGTDTNGGQRTFSISRTTIQLLQQASMLPKLIPKSLKRSSEKH
jgi:hypothetical protein